MIVLAPVVDSAQQRFYMGRGAASSLVVLGLTAVIALLMLIVLSPLIDSVGEFADEVPMIVSEFNESGLGKQLNDESHASEFLQQNAPKIVSGVGNAAGGLLGVTASAFGVFVMAFSVIFMTLFLVKDLPSYRRSLLGLLGNDDATRWHTISDRVITTTSRYMIGNIVISLICATIYGVTAVLLGLPYPLALAVIAGVLDMIPNIGSLLAGIIIGILALTVSPLALVIFVIVILVYQQFENYVLQPTIIGRAANISGFLVILSVLFWGALFGVVGAIVGVPITAAILIVINELTVDRRAGRAGFKSTVAAMTLRRPPAAARPDWPTGRGRRSGRR
ncbi:MAG: AI-2E family transporter [Thermoleophilia bacterium]|nr:AI-2E family transporter [Thermoleophilia bacterium]